MHNPARHPGRFDHRHNRCGLRQLSVRRSHSSIGSNIDLRPCPGSRRGQNIVLRRSPCSIRSLSRTVVVAGTVGVGTEGKAEGMYERKGSAVVQAPFFLAPSLCAPVRSGGV
jgi:hypothetical protein